MTTERQIMVKLTTREKNSVTISLNIYRIFSPTKLEKPAIFLYCTN